MEEHLPTIPVSDFIKLLDSSSKIIGVIDIGDTKAFILKGTKFIGKRTIIIRTDLPELGYEHSMGLAILAGIIGPCMEWFQLNRDFKDGGYIVPQEK